MNAKAVKTEKPRAYLLKGDEEFQKQKDLDKLLKALVSPDFADFDMEQIEGDSASSDRVMAGVSMPPFASEQRVVLVRYANKIPEPEQEKLASQLVKTPPTGCLILVNPAPEKTDGRVKKGSEVIGDLSKAVRKVGEVRTFEKMKAGSAIPFAKSIFASAGKKIDSRALAAFVQRVGTDSQVISTEAQKLINYSGDDLQITVAEVNDVTSETPEEKIFKLVDAISARNPSNALKLLDELFETGDDPKGDAPKTLSTIARHFRLLWQTKMLAEADVQSFLRSAVPADLQDCLSADPNVIDVVARQKWMGDRLPRQARAFSRDDLTRCFSAIANADLMLKQVEGGIEDPKMVMELLVMELAKKVR